MTSECDLTVYTRSALSSNEAVSLSHELKRMLNRIIGPQNNNAKVRVKTEHSGQSTLTVSETQLLGFQKSFGLTSIDSELARDVLSKRAKTEYSLLCRGANENPLLVTL